MLFFPGRCVVGSLDNRERRVQQATRGHPLSLPQDAIGEGGHARLYRMRDEQDRVFAMKVSQLADKGHCHRETTAVRWLLFVFVAI